MVLLLALVFLLESPVAAIARPVFIPTGGQHTSGDPVGGERKDEKDPADGEIDPIEGGEMDWLGRPAPPAGPDRGSRSLPVLILFRFGFVGGPTIPFFLGPQVIDCTRAR